MGKGGFLIYTLPYGSSTLSFRLPPDLEVHRIMSRNARLAANEAGDSICDETIIRGALTRPIGAAPLCQLAQGKQSAVILISDMSRLCPSYLFLGALLDQLNAGGISDNRISIIVALGMHRRHTGDELKDLVGEKVYDRVSILNHSAQAEDCVSVGITSRGTPVAVNRHVVEADLRIATGNLEPHRIAGVSGGIKALVPGVAAHSTIEANHALSQLYQIEPGDPDNPIRLDMEEAHSFVPIHFLFNVIVTPERKLLAAFAGDIIEAHRAGVAAVKDIFFHTTSRRYPLVIASAGGHPKDLQLYQAVKALQNAADLTSPGGTIVLAAECPEMLGNGLFQYWLETKGSRELIVEELKQSFRLGPHKLEHIDAVLKKHTVYLHSSIPRSLVELIGFCYAGDFQQTIDTLHADQHAPIALIPYASITFTAKGSNKPESSNAKPGKEC